MLLATNQADSIMGSLGLARSDECRTVQAVLRLEDFNGKDTLDENYAALWAALEAEMSVLSAQGADSAGCSYADGAITVGEGETRAETAARGIPRRCVVAAGKENAWQNM